ncbi:MAG: TetR family transcriptional regulator [Thermoanaerobaculia bacterium]|nr:TetR family transcriptional regulator [Thermoanaerobaculia bacterium]
MVARSVETDPVKGTGKRERILRASIEVFARTGYFNAKVSEIAKEAGVADGTIYLYFLGKEDLLISIFREHMRAYLEGVSLVMNAERDPQSRLRKVIRFHLESLGNDRPLAIVFQVELRQSLKFMSLFSHQEVADYLNILRRTIEEGQQQGLFRASLQPHITAKAVFGILDEMVTSWVLSEKDARLADVADPICDFVLNGLL